MTEIRSTSRQERYDMAACYMGDAATGYVNATEKSAADKHRDPHAAATVEQSTPYRGTGPG